MLDDIFDELEKLNASVSITRLASSQVNQWSVTIAVGLVASTFRRPTFEGALIAAYQSVRGALELERA